MQPKMPAGDNAIIGTFMLSGKGAAYYFNDLSSGGAEQTQSARLTASDAVLSDYFGCSVSIWGDTAVIGAEYDDDGGDNSGSAYIFKDLSKGRTEQTETAKLTAGDAAANDNYGWSVSILGDYAIVGSAFDDDGANGTGSAYFYTKGTEEEQYKLPVNDFYRQLF